MRDSGIEKLIGVKIVNICTINFQEGKDAIELEDSFLFELEDGTLIQFFNNYNTINVIDINNLNDVRYLGFEAIPWEDVPKYLSKKHTLSLRKIALVKKFNKSSYSFGIAFFDKDEKFICGFCLGYDEMLLIKDMQNFQNMLDQYSSYTSHNIPMENC